MTSTSARPQGLLPRTDTDAWWRDAVIYQIYPRSFADANGDGIGDIQGIREHIDHLVALGVDAVWLSPFYPSPQVDAGYDVSDYFDLAPEYGSLQDLDALIADLHEAGIRVIVDLVPNHSSDQHAWFRAALEAGPGSPERDRYIFRHSDDGAPNNWGSLFGGPAWRPVEPLTGRSEDRGWYYLHLFAAEQPDFNWSNADVHEHFRSFLRFWVERGIEGLSLTVWSRPRACPTTTSAPTGGILPAPRTRTRPTRSCPMSDLPSTSPGSTTSTASGAVSWTRSVRTSSWSPRPGCPRRPMPPSTCAPTR